MTARTYTAQIAKEEGENRRRANNIFSLLFFTPKGGAEKGPPTGKGGAMNIGLIFDIVVMIMILLLHVGAVIVGIICVHECGPVRRPWEKEERKAAQKREKDELRARREFWGS